MNVTELAGKVALITGASRGIGRAIALEPAAAGCDIMLTARDREALEAVAAEVRTLGRKAATRPGFAYSMELKKSGLVWNEANLTKWVAGPQRVVPGTKMTFAGLSSKKQQADVVAYLDTLK